MLLSKNRTDQEKTIIGHPPGLFLLFFTEMWERFSFYGMRALLIFYLTKHFLFSDSKSYSIYAAYASLVYIMPVIGGFIADKLLGGRKAVLYGAVLITIGHFLMGFEGNGGNQSLAVNCFYIALAFIIVGTGFLKGNISAIVGSLYDKNDLRRDPAFTIFYMGINLGGALGPLICGYVGEKYGWRYGFGMAGVGMAIGLLIFVFCRPLLKGRGESACPEKLAQKVFGLSKEIWIYILSVTAIVFSGILLNYYQIVGQLLGIIGIFLVIYIFYSAIRLPSIARDRLFAAMILMIGSVLFWSLFEQAGSSLNMFTDRYTDRHIAGVDIATSMFQSLNSIYIILLAPVMAGLWTWLNKRNLEPSTFFKFGMGLVGLGLGFLVLVAGAKMNAHQLTPVLFIFLIYLFHTLGELCLSPVGLAAITRLSPVHMAGLMVGTWFFSTAFGEYGAGMIAKMTSNGSGDGFHNILNVYSSIGWLSVVFGGGIFVLTPVLKKLLHENEA
ncbi:amino acid/peptide transporter [Zymomonas mobilis subsp. mobilis ZM4 = ATCC 31821]|uniref:Amino acid/peptide transporter n=3 Tax=Zymomonas mobilis TaxID=542 RepID=Q5NNT5_ZYMMO|nr:oligopeptide:H+ symporter [Zymomonas mobilis]AAV89625.1 amino acid/peptide transporter [Zymomonas mobilis subsp. mobilis ZM4 = ATCC 31821]ACV74856.1 amino acid/peptide transporter [Zymomonas mobilis subsp. mobilis NCIMB 11163]AEH62159.1 amino acid/peptide transporter [Zymomonas mobilis subsp. mobilis ATCC 10988]ART92816.1 MFS transporter [Zymomonas mobilis subsp. mobilis]AVZ25908.1 amino acid/peptide transporter [Zymomonas mobilis subsp. mobilis]